MIQDKSIVKHDDKIDDLKDVGNDVVDDDVAMMTFESGNLAVNI